MNEPIHAQRILRALADRLQPAPCAAINTPFGVTLQPACGLFHIDERVSAPGLDACTPRVLCEVAGMGTRADYPGLWYLLRGIGASRGLSLVREADLRRPDTRRTGVARSASASSEPVRSGKVTVVFPPGCPPARGDGQAHAGARPR